MFHIIVICLRGNEFYSAVQKLLRHAKAYGLTEIEIENTKELLRRDIKRYNELLHKGEFNA